MTSIRSYDAQIFLCTECGQPCYEGEIGLAHFNEQWDGIHCPQFPLASGRLVVEWDDLALRDLKSTYPDTYPRHPLSAAI